MGIEWVTYSSVAYSFCRLAQVFLANAYLLALFGVNFCVGGAPLEKP